MSEVAPPFGAVAFLQVRAVRTLHSLSLIFVVFLLAGVTTAAASSPVPPDSADPGAREGDTVILHYTGSTVSGEVFESTREDAPRGIVIGSKRVIPAFENGLLGIRAGEQRRIRIPSDQAFGPYRDEPGMKTRLLRASLSHRLAPRVGMRLNAAVFADESAQLATHVPVTIVEVTDEYLLIDANHPLAGKDLVFEVEAIQVLPAGH